MPEPRQLRGTASASLADLLSGPAQRARVLAHLPRAVYLQVGSSVHGRVVAVVTRDGIGLPNAITIREPSSVRPFGAGAAPASATVGQGGVAWPGVVVTSEGWVDLRYRPRGIDADGVAERLSVLEATIARDAQPLDAELTRRAAAMDDAIAAADLDAAIAAADRLVGLGGGLTPAGDDVVAGVVAAGRSFALGLGAPGFDRFLYDLGTAVARRAEGRTTALSASLLWHAARGELAVPARHVVRGLDGETPLLPAVARLLRVGHSSGSDLARGIALGVGAALAAASSAASSDPLTMTASAAGER